MILSLFSSAKKVLQKIGRPFFISIYLTLTILVLFIKLSFAALQSIKQKSPEIELSFPNIFSKYILYFFVSVCILFISGYLFFLNIIYNLPSPETLSTRQIELSTKIYDRNGVLLYKIYKDKDRSLVSFEEVPQHIKLATLAAEDSEFYSHQGFSVKGISRALYKYLKSGKVTGGSTITQQLVKNAILTPEKTVARKLREIILSLGVEHKYSKDEILTMYLNEVPYGGTAYGIKEASRIYFNKDLEQLSIAEAALLAGLTKSPTLYSPFGNNPGLAKQRQENILELMHKHGFITKEQLDREKERTIDYAENKIEIKAPHFVMHVKDLIFNMFGEEDVQTLGLEVHTTLDYKLQKYLEQVISGEINSLRGLNVTNAAGMIIDPKSGEILAMVGSEDYFSDQGNVNVLTRLRQPGSSIKPINYAYALSHGYTPASIIDDSPVRYRIPGQADYVPQNYDAKYRGKITLRSALAESRNIPAVKILDSYGVDNMISLAQKMGITTWNEQNRYGLSLTLGGGDVKLIDLTQAYQVLANKGFKTELKSIKYITGTDAKYLYKSCLLVSNCEQKEVLPPEIAFQITDILSDNKARAPAFGQFSTLVINNHPEVAVKTGTSNDLRDNLTIGYNQEYLVSVWVGNNDNSPMSRVASGITGASSIWNKTFEYLLRDKPSIAWEVPSNLSRKTTCNSTGKYEEWFVEGTFIDSCKLKTAESKERSKSRLRKIKVN